MTFALVPAGGRSRRMGRPKLSLPLGGRSVLERVVDALRDGGVEHILVVVGPHVPELLPLARGAGAFVHLLPAETPDMRATVEAGLRRLEEQFRPAAADRWFLVPADHPTLEGEVVRRLLQAAGGQPQFSIFIPVYQGRRGHPVCLTWQHVDGIRAWRAEEGLNTYLRQHAAETLEVPVESAAVLCDLDTPEEYERLLQAWDAGRQGR